MLIRNRWQLAYTLVKNPVLVQYRVHGLRSKRNEDETLLLHVAKKELWVNLKEKCLCADVKNKMQMYALDRLVEEYAEEIFSKLTTEEDFQGGKDLDGVQIQFKGDNDVRNRPAVSRGSDEDTKM